MVKEVFITLPPLTYYTQYAERPRKILIKMVILQQAAKSLQSSFVNLIGGQRLPLILESR